MVSEAEVIKIKTLESKKVPLFRALYESAMDAFSKRRFVQKWNATPVDIRFRCTNMCNENCLHCFECSDARQPARHIPVKEAAFYHNGFGNKFQSVYITGGEWSLIYDVEPHYMLKMFDAFDVHKADQYVVQTNCRWIFGPHRDEIIDDLCLIQKRLGAAGKILKIDTSVDRFHSPRSLDGVRELICRVAADRRFDATKIRIMSCQLDSGMARKNVLQPEYFEQRGVHLNFQPRDIFQPYFSVCYANNVRIVIHEEGPTMQIGRAAQNKLGYKIFWPTRQCGGLAGERQFMELALREDGMMKWHSFYDWDIMVPYRDVHGACKPASQIKSELIEMAWRRVLRTNVKELAFGLIPIYGIFRARGIDRQIVRSWEENTKKVVFHLQRPWEISR